MQPACFIRPDRKQGTLFVGHVSSTGSADRVPLLGFHTDSSRSRGQSFVELFTEPGKTWIFNGILLLPTDPQYRLPRPYRSTTHLKSGIRFLSKPERPWKVSLTGGLGDLTDDSGYFSDPAGLSVSVFDRKSTFTCIERYAATSIDSVDQQVDRECDQVRDFLTIVTANGTEIVVVKLEFAEREYPVPTPPRTATAEIVEEPPPEQPRRRTRKAS